MPNQSKSQRDYKDFFFRRRYDHFLRYRLLQANEIETYEAAKELGFQLKMADVEKGMSDNSRKKKNKKHRRKRISLITSRVLSWLKSIVGKNTNNPVSTKKRSSKKRKKKNKSR